MDVDTIKSTKIKKLYNELIEGNKEALECFWEEIKLNGSPLIEKIDGDDKNVNVTFLYQSKEKIQNVIVYGAFPSNRYNENIMIQLLNSDLWFKTYKVRNDVKFSYNYSVNDSLDDDYKKRSNNLILDKFNPNEVVFPKDDEDEEDVETKKSLVELCNVEEEIWTKNFNLENKGTIEIHRFHSEILKDSRRIWIYKPYKFDINKKYNLIVITDGFIHVNIIDSKNVIDNLIEKNMIEESICLFIDSGKDRFEELICNKNFADFIVKEIIPWASCNYKLNIEPEKTVIGGLSLGGLFAAYVALEYGEIFGNVLAQSGSFWWNNEWLIDKYKDSDIPPKKFYLNSGILEDRPYDDEPIMRECIEKMKNVLLDKGHTVMYERFPSGHDYLCWGEKFATGLIELMGKNI